MQMGVYVNYNGNCEETFRFYEQHLGGRIAMMMKHGENPGPNRMPAEWTDKILHAQIAIGGVVLMGADIPDAQPMRSAYLTLTVDSVDEAERIYGLLSERGQIFMPMEETFFAARFAMLRDRFGTSWLLQAARSGF